MAGESNQVKWRGTLKIYPAIADLDAIEDVVEGRVLQDAVGNDAKVDSVGATAGKIWVITSIAAFNQEGTVSDLYLAKLIGVTTYMLTYKQTLKERESVNFHGHLILDSGEKVRAGFTGCQGATDECRLYFTGYQIDKY